MVSFFVALTGCAAAASGAAWLLRRMLDPIERVLSGPRRRRLEEAPVHVLARADDVEGHAPLKVPIEAIHCLHHVRSRRCYELAGFVSSQDLPGEATHGPEREVRVHISVWWNAPAVRKLLEQRGREEREAALRSAERSAHSRVSGS